MSVTKYKTTGKSGFNMGQTSAGLKEQMKQTELERTKPGGFSHLGKQALPKVKPPFLPARAATASEYCLVLDLDETLIHYVDSGPESYFLVRPFCKEFLDELSKCFEIVIFTAGMQEYADWVIDQIDTEGRIKHRLYREHT